LSRETEDINLRMQACLCAVNYYSWVGDLASYSIVTEEIRKMAQSPTASPLLVVTWKWIEALMYNRSTESYDQAIRSISEGLEIAEKTGIHIWDQMLFSQRVYSSLNKGDMALAGEFLKKMEATIDKSRRQSLFQYHYLSGWYHFLNGNLSRAAPSAETSFQLTEETGMYFSRILGSLLMAQLFHERGEDQSATAQLSSAKALIRRSGSRILEYMCLLKEAQFNLDEENKETEGRGLEALRKAMELGRKESYLHLFPSWQPSAMTRLCLRALSEEIEIDYVQDLIRKHYLFPDVLPPDLENWPWPVKICTLGRFELSKNGKPIRFSGKVQKKPLLLLKAMIALGGKDIREDQMADLLWPEADGDQAHSAFTTTLSRLRQLLGEEKTIKFQEGKATLDPRYCWVDVWAFDQMFGKAEALWKESQQSADLRSETLSLIEKAIGIYQGHFLSGDEEYGWTTPYRERFRTRFLQLIMKFGQNLKETNQWEKAIEHFQKALEVDDLAEELYQHLMVCYYQLDQQTKIVETYRRCKETLSSALGMGPSQKTEVIYKKLIERE
jgi:DNA-binding SARP family transcriptional activator